MTGTYVPLSDQLAVNTALRILITPAGSDSQLGAIILRPLGKAFQQQS
jgi:hypothetical protein